MSNQGPEPKSPSPLSPLSFPKKCVISILVSLHFFAILTAVVSSGNGPYKPPVLATDVNRPIRPYLDMLFMQSGYRFFAPNPGPTTVLWFRIVDENGGVRWREFPGREEFRTQIAYSRMLSLSELGSVVGNGDSADAETLTLSQDARICVSSFVRHLSTEKSLQVERSFSSKEIQSVEVYRVSHHGILPDDIREGWSRTDLRLYQPLYLGSFQADGTPIDVSVAEYRRIEILTADMIEHDIAPVLLAERDGGPGHFAAQLRDLGIPEPVRILIGRRPQVVSRSAAEIEKQMLVVFDGTRKASLTTRNSQNLSH